MFYEWQTIVSQTQFFEIHHQWDIVSLKHIYEIYTIRSNSPNCRVHCLSIQDFMRDPICTRDNVPLVIYVPMPALFSKISIRKLEVMMELLYVIVVNCCFRVSHHLSPWVFELKKIMRREVAGHYIVRPTSVQHSKNSECWYHPISLKLVARSIEAENQFLALMSNAEFTSCAVHTSLTRS